MTITDDILRDTLNAAEQALVLAKQQSESGMRALALADEYHNKLTDLAKVSSEAVAALREENNKLRELIVLLNQDRADKDLYIEQLRFILVERSQ